jgi:hypothetical protein
VDAATISSLHTRRSFSVGAGRGVLVAACAKEAIGSSNSAVSARQIIHTGKLFLGINSFPPAFTIHPSRVTASPHFHRAARRRSRP